MSDAPAGKITGRIWTWPTRQRPPVWITINGTRHAGREHAHAEHGQARLVAWGTEYRWVRADQVTRLGDDTPL